MANAQYIFVALTIPPTRSIQKQQLTEDIGSGNVGEKIQEASLHLRVSPLHGPVGQEQEGH